MLSSQGQVGLYMSKMVSICVVNDGIICSNCVGKSKDAGIRDVLHCLNLEHVEGRLFSDQGEEKRDDWK